MKIGINGRNGRINPERTSWCFYIIRKTQAKGSCWSYGCKNASTCRPTDNWTESESIMEKSEMLSKYFTMIFLLCGYKHKQCPWRGSNSNRPVVLVHTYPTDALSPLPAHTASSHWVGSRQCHVSQTMSGDVAFQSGLEGKHVWWTDRRLVVPKESRVPLGSVHLGPRSAFQYIL